MSTQPHRPPSMIARIGRTSATVVLSALAIALGLALGVLAAVLGLGLSLPVGLIAGGVVLFATTWLLTALAHKIWPSSRPARPGLTRRKAPYAVAGATLVVASLTAGMTVLTPIDGEESPSAAIEPSYFDLDTGSRIAYWKFEAAGASASDVPIIFVHGGPGGFNKPIDLEFFPALTATGHDVYLYDQPGAGYSPNLELDEYSQERTLADLDAIREQTGSDKAIIIGQSAGGYITEAYVANYPEHVEKAILTAPGGYLPSDELTAAEAAEGEKLQELDPHYDERSAELSALIEKTTPRIMTSVLLHSFGFGAAAENLTPQDDLKRWSATQLDSGSGLNFLSNLELAKDFGVHAADTIEKLAQVDVPTMMLKPQFDYLSWASQYPYVEANRDMQVVYVENAEHSAWAMQPEATLAALATFIEGGEQETYTGTESPAITLGNR